MPYDVIMLGPPGSGKSSQAAYLSERLGVPLASEPPRSPTSGFVLDCGLMSLETARQLDATLRARGRQPDVIMLELPDRLVVRRAASWRRWPAGRTRRYRRAIAPVLAFYESRRLLHRVDGSGSPSEVRAAVDRALGLRSDMAAEPVPPPVSNVPAMEAMAAAFGLVLTLDQSH